MPFSLLEARTLEDAVGCTRGDVYAKFSRNRDSSWLSGMLELPVAAPGADVAPAIFVQQSYHFSDLHVPTLASASGSTTRESSVIR